MKLVPLRQTGGKPREPGTAQEKFEAGDLVLAAPHAGFQNIAHKSGHAQARLGRLYAQPFRGVLAQRDGNVFHGTNIV
ncbi:MAG: hypothetical protein WBF43_00310 [Methylocella sp.]